MKSKMSFMKAVLTGMDFFTFLFLPKSNNGKFLIPIPVLLKNKFPF